MKRAMLRKHFTQHFWSAWSKHSLKATAIVLLVVALLPVEAKAYTDPGTGTFLLQMTLAAITGSLFFMRALRHRIRMLFKRNKNSSDNEDENRADNQLGG